MIIKTQRDKRFFKIEIKMKIETSNINGVDTTCSININIYF